MLDAVPGDSRLSLMLLSGSHDCLSATADGLSVKSLSLNTARLQEHQ
jgi:hypothetical protein